ncbi:hypothetical protein OEZ85_010775 [Tetradesmus obliquus]|uniref:Haloacid dehalogenase-like hydrolase domain-containing protein 3 n=1 Tax=Tetradesmus obliquus TaxID=3088 RepID=A0ABY8TQE6_TETOB|nr:hypothetical protein OEZ85_010775 [Tetradesmus obliquus]
MGVLNGKLQQQQHSRALHSTAQPLQLQQVAAAAMPRSWLSLSRPAYKAVLVDAAGTLLVPSERTADVYLRYASKYGVDLSEQEVLQRFRSAYNTPWGQSPLRYVGDGRPFWRFIVQQSTGCCSEALFEEVYEYYEQPEAWELAPGAVQALSKLRAAGVRLAVVSNFDTRLRPILAALNVDSLFDAVVVSAEVGVEKPNPVIFESALQQLRLRPSEVVHVGDDRRNDVWGARDAGVAAWLWGVDVHSFDQVARRVLLGVAADDEEEE